MSGTIVVLGLLLGVLPDTALAGHHLIKVREVSPGYMGASGAFVELQMYAAGQNQTDGQFVRIYDARGTVSFTSRLSNVPNGENQRTILISNGQADNVTPDIDTAWTIPQLAGAACYESPESSDCVTWGNFTPQAGFPDPQSAAVPNGMPSGSSLDRTIARDCATALDAGDDTDDSAADFSLGSAPTPRNNGTPPSETPCSPGDTDGDGLTDDVDACPTRFATTPNGCPVIFHADWIRPQTTITRAPSGKISEDRAKLRFTSNEAGSTFECKLDEKSFDGCASPKSYRKLADGKHEVHVRAIDPAGNVDPTPTEAVFRVDTG